MNLICCTEHCIYQSEGVCTLERAASCGEICESGCAYFVPLHDEENLSDIR